MVVGEETNASDPSLEVKRDEGFVEYPDAGGDEDDEEAASERDRAFVVAGVARCCARCLSEIAAGVSPPSSS
jgi:hypothetical protein